MRKIVGGQTLLSTISKEYQKSPYNNIMMANQNNIS
jgi:hypothetical protein